MARCEIWVFQTAVIDKESHFAHKAELWPAGGVFKEGRMINELFLGT